MARVTRAIPVADQPIPEATAQFERHLAGILRSPEFSRSSRMSQLLRFVTEYHAANPEAEITERLLAERVFGKDEQWDPKIDPAVRIAFSRLREKLKRYYGNDPDAGPIRIELPSGGYVPRIVRNQEPERVQEAPRTQTLAPNPPPGRRRTPILTMAGAALAAVALTAAWVSRSPKRTHPALDFRSSPVAAELGLEISPAISPDGRWVAYVWNRSGDRFDIYRRRAAGEGEAERLTSGPGDSFYPAWSPDGEKLAFLRTGSEPRLAILDLRRREEKVAYRIHPEPGAWTGEPSGLLGNTGPSWTPDGQGLIFGEAQGDASGETVWSLNLANGGKTRLFSSEGISRIFWPRLSPQGTYLAFALYSSHGAGEVMVFDLRKKLARRITSDNRTICGVSWGNDENTIVFSSNRGGTFQLWKSRLSGGAPEPIPANSSFAAEPAVSKKGDAIAFADRRENWNIWRTAIRTAGQPEQSARLIASSGRNYDPRYSPDGRSIAFLSDRSDSWQIWLADAEGKSLRQLTKQKSPWLGSFQWSPDGRTIVFEGRPHDHAALFWLDVATGNVSPVEVNQFEERLPAWSRDGRAIYFSSNRDGPRSIYRRDLATGQVTPMTSREGSSSAESPNGEYLAFTGGDHRIWRIGLKAGGEESLLLTPGQLPGALWTFSGNDIWFAQSPTELARFDGRRVTQILRLAHPLIPYVASLASSSDGRNLLYATRDYEESDVRIWAAK